MTVKHETVSVGATAVSLLAGAPDPPAARFMDRKMPTVTRSVLLTNTSLVSVYLGGPGVTTSAWGYELKAGERLPLSLSGTDDPHAIAATGTASAWQRREHNPAAVPELAMPGWWGWGHWYVPASTRDGGWAHQSRLRPR